MAARYYGCASVTRASCRENGQRVYAMRAAMIVSRASRRAMPLLPRRP